MSNFAVMMQKAQKMKQKMDELQGRMGDLSATSDVNGGAVTATVNGKFELKSIKITPEALGDVELLEDLIISAVNDARSKVEKQVAEETGKITQDLGLPAGLGLPF